MRRRGLEAQESGPAQGSPPGDRVMRKPPPLVALLAALPLSIAAAADLPPPPETDLPIIPNWGGFYVGAFVGGVSGTQAGTTESLRLDNGNYWFRPFHGGYGYRVDGSFLGGATLGYNLQLPQSPWVVGIEGEYGYLRESGAGRDVNQAYYSAFIGDFSTQASAHHTSIGNDYGYGLIGGRIGYAVDRFLIYVKTGAIVLDAVE
jgi:hypothetical protein